MQKLGSVGLACVFLLMIVGCDNFARLATKNGGKASASKTSAKKSASIAGRLAGHWRMTQQIIFDPGSHVRLGDTGEWDGKNPVREPAKKGILWGELYITTASKPWAIFASGFSDDFVLMRAQMQTTSTKHQSMGVSMWSADEGDSVPAKARKFQLRLSESGHLELHKRGDTWVAVYEWVDEATEP